jgi:hypothetical protein
MTIKQRLSDKKGLPAITEDTNHDIYEYYAPYTVTDDDGKETEVYQYKS